MKKENTFIMTAEGFLEAENELNELKNFLNVFKTPGAK